MVQLNRYIYCLESVANASQPEESVVFNSLSKLAAQFQITNVYQACDSIESFEMSISTLLYEDRHYSDYAFLYLVFEGKPNALKIDDFFYSFEEIAEFFEGKLQGKIVHFANTIPLDLEEETFQYFLDVTGAKAISGYAHMAGVESWPLDNFYFALSQEFDDVVTLTEVLLEKQPLLCAKLGFRMYF